MAGALNTILDTPVGDGVITINLRNGTVNVNFDDLLVGITGHGLNNLNINEDLLSTAVVENLVTRIGSVLNTVPALVQTALTTALLVNVAVCVVGTGPSCTTPIADIGTGLRASVPNQTLGSVINGTATASISLKVAGLPVTIPVSTLLGAFAAPIKATLFSPTGVISTVIPTVTTVVNLILTAIDPLVDLLNGFVSLRGNVQPDNGPIYSQDAFFLTVGDVLGTGGVGSATLAHAQVGPNTAAVAASVDAVQAGSSLPVSGTGWPANTEVSLQLTDPGGGANAGGPVTVTTDASGVFTTTYPVPADTAAAAGYTLTATAGDVTATDTTEVTAATPGDVKTNSSASADATANGDPATQAAAQADASADASTTADPEANTAAAASAQAAA